MHAEIIGFYIRFSHLIVFDISLQNERHKDSLIGMKIKIEFNSNILDTTHACALILSDRIMQLHYDVEE
jgi:hypothetical protein